MSVGMVLETETMGQVLAVVLADQPALAAVRNPR
jgi:hypothetical protein